MARTRTPLLAPALLVLAALLTGSCGGGGAPGDGTPARTVALNRSDAGETASLRIGDHLVLNLGTVPNGSWRLAGYPRDALSLVSSEPSMGSFEFRAKAAGGGALVVNAVPGCGPEEPVPCATPDMPADAVGGAFPPRPFSVTVAVS
jgi:hypothetical protein